MNEPDLAEDRKTFELAIQAVHVIMDVEPEDRQGQVDYAVNLLGEAFAAYQAGLKEAAPRIVCETCFTSSWAPCPEGFKHAVRDGDGWMMCQFCSANERLRAASSEITQLRQKLVGCGEALVAPPDFSNQSRLSGFPPEVWDVSGVAGAPVRFEDDREALANLCRQFCDSYNYPYVERKCEDPRPMRDSACGLIERAYGLGRQWASSAAQASTPARSVGQTSPQTDERTHGLGSTQEIDKSSRASGVAERAENPPEPKA